MLRTFGSAEPSDQQPNASASETQAVQRSQRVLNSATRQPKKQRPVAQKIDSTNTVKRLTFGRCCGGAVERPRGFGCADVDIDKN